MSQTSFINAPMTNNYHVTADAAYRPDAITLRDRLDFYRLREDGHLCDVTVRFRTPDENDKFQNVIFDAHKVVLIAASPYFRLLYDTGQLTSKEFVDLPSMFQPATFALLLDVIYGKCLTKDDVRALSPDISSTLKKLKFMADYLQLDDVASQIGSWMDDSLRFSSTSDCKVESDIKRESDVSLDASIDAFDLMPDEDSDDDRDVSTSVISTISSIASGCTIPFPPLTLRRSSSKKKSVVKLIVDDKRPEQYRDVDEPSPELFASVSLTPSYSTTTTTTTTKRGRKRGKSVPVHSALDPDDPVLQSRFKSLSQDEVMDMFSNPRDRVIIGKKRLETKTDRPEGDVNSWSHGTDIGRSMIGKSIPYANRTQRVNKVWNDVKIVAGVIRGPGLGRDIELTTASGYVQYEIPTRVTAKNKSSCPVCKLKIVRSSISQLNEHMASHLLHDHNYVWIDFAFVCDLCDYVHFSAQDIKEHLHSFHGVPRDDDSENHCARCGQTFASPSKLDKHRKLCGEIGDEKEIQKAGREKEKNEDRDSEDDEADEPEKVRRYTHVCGFCRKSFLSSVMLENHLSKEHGAPYRFPCTQSDCSYETNTRSTFLHHLFSTHKINTGALPALKCSYCDYVTISASHLRKHELTHTALEFTLECPFESCDSSFRQERHLKRHVVDAHGDLKLPCPHCGSTFVSKLKLRRHVQRMHTRRYRNFKCAYCDHATVARENCTTHIKRSHKGKPINVINLIKSGKKPLPV